MTSANVAAFLVAHEPINVHLSLSKWSSNFIGQEDMSSFLKMSSPVHVIQKRMFLQLKGPFLITHLVFITSQIKFIALQITFIASQIDQFAWEICLLI